MNKLLYQYHQKLLQINSHIEILSGKSKRTKHECNIYFALCDKQGMVMEFISELEAAIKAEEKVNY